MDKRRYVERHPHHPRKPQTMATAETGKPALDGYTVLDRAGLKPERDRYCERPDLPKTMMDEHEAEYPRVFGIAIYDGD